MGCTLDRLICVDSHKMDDWEARAEHEHAMKEFGATDQSACSVDLQKDFCMMCGMIGEGMHDEGKCG